MTAACTTMKMMLAAAVLHPSAPFMRRRGKPQKPGRVRWSVAFMFFYAIFACKWFCESPQQSVYRVHRQEWHLWRPSPSLACETQCGAALSHDLRVVCRAFSPKKGPAWVVPCWRSCRRGRRRGSGRSIHGTEKYKLLPTNGVKCKFGLPVQKKTKNPTLIICEMKLHDECSSTGDAEPRSPPIFSWCIFDRTRDSLARSKTRCSLGFQWQ